MDAMGRPPAGMMQGRLSGYGAYDQCLAIRHNDGIFQGKYCMVHLRYDGGEILPSVKTLIKKFADHLGFEMPAWGDYSNELGFVHGIRVLSATWVMLGHSLMVKDPHSMSNLMSYFKRFHDEFLFSVQVNSFMAVESFLVITGFLSGYLVTKAPRVHLSPIIVIIIALFRRYVRLIVPMAALMGFTFLIPALVDGPALRDYWPVFESSCTYHWWKIFTMTENYMDNISDMCLPHYWYIAVDFPARNSFNCDPSQP
ncbi:hypothetical protein MRX96_012359 [Rhipicephalus microplus]